MKNDKYGLISLKKEFPNDEACLAFIFDTLHSRKCSCGGVYSPIKGRKQFQCSKCRFQIAPTAGTIFHKSPTPLSLWFHALLVFSNSKSGISAKYLERELEVTYKCAWRILSQIRTALKQDNTKLKGDVEIDSGYIGGRKYAGKNNEKMSNAMSNKSIVVVAVERGGNMKAQIIDGNTAEIMTSFIANNIEKKATSIITDSSPVYVRSAKEYDWHGVNHRKHEWVRGDIHINTIETFFAHLKRSVRGTFKSLSRQHLQSYLDAFVFHYNNRYSDKERFASLLGALLHV
jgi:transposase